MARKSKQGKSSTPEPSERRLTGLLVPAGEAKQQLEERIQLGRELLSLRIANAADLQAAEEKEGAWGAYNVELLRRLFDSDEFAEDYTRFYGMSFPMNPSLGQEVEMLHDRIRDRVARLQKIVVRLPLLHQTSAMSQGQSENTGSSQPSGTRVFVVHGHDEAAKQAVARFIERLDLTPVILHEQANQGLTIIEKLERYSEVGFAVILLTPDDVGGKRAEAGATQTLNARARQNVIAELGYFVGKLGRMRVSVLHKASVEIPSDWDGVLYTIMDKEEAWQLKLAKELRAAGYEVDFNRLG